MTERNSRKEEKKKEEIKLVKCKKGHLSTTSNSQTPNSTMAKTKELSKDTRNKIVDLHQAGKTESAIVSECQLRKDLVVAYKTDHRHGNKILVKLGGITPIDHHGPPNAKIFNWYYILMVNLGPMYYTKSRAEAWDKISLEPDLGPVQSNPVHNTQSCPVYSTAHFNAIYNSPTSPMSTIQSGSIPNTKLTLVPTSKSSIQHPFQLILITNNQSNLQPSIRSTIHNQFQ
ncbi:hypothetical protein QTP86_009338 [Hemibagrus guttatus]|nr:hypothetical protein QTP86_009338 [Hemibagrus guttatus]